LTISISTGHVGLLPPDDPRLPTGDFFAFQTVTPLPDLTPNAGNCLCKKRIDMHLSMTQLAERLGLGITDSAIERWEKNQNRPTPEHRNGIVDFLGFDPALAKTDRRSLTMTLLGSCHRLKRSAGSRLMSHGSIR